MSANATIPSLFILKLSTELKVTSSSRIRRKFNYVAGAFNKNVLWSRGYFVGACAFLAIPLPAASQGNPSHL
ncbi:transposase [Vibrio sp. SG41-7]|uniref:transposase n=1 Tax=Vibrio sp. SG41-7 TaxID=2760973 RepID=UPI001601DF6C|nr:transposase [Vibrio sp. SG41-7]